MLSDPLTIPNVSIVFDASWPAANEVAVQSKTFNGIEFGPGPKSRRSMSPATLALLSLAKGELSVSHQATASGRTRSVIRVDITKNDAALLPHTCACYLVLDREANLTSEGTIALQKALAIMSLLQINGVAANSITTTSIMTEFLNGES